MIKWIRQFIPQTLVRRIYSDEMVFRIINAKRKHLWIIAAPKSGSTWLTAILQNALSWPSQALVPQYGRREQEIDIRKLISETCHENLFSPAHHTHYSEETVKIITRANIKCVFLYRNIFDQIVSGYEHCQNPRERLNGCSVYLVRERYDKLTQQQQWNMTLDLAVPWYLRQYVGWFDYFQSHNPSNFFLCSYDDLRRDTQCQIQHILEWAGCELPTKTITDAIERAAKANTRKNKAITGRAIGLLRLADVKHIVRLANYYPDIDLSLIGITKAIRDRPEIFFEQ